MQKYARVRDGIVVELITPPEGKTLAEILHPNLAQLFKPCAANVSLGWAEDGDGFSAPSAESIEPDLVAYAANKRWEVEVGGIPVAGIPIATDDRSKIMIMGARVAAMADPGWATVWHGADGNTYPLNAAAIIAISDAVQAHVNAGFAAFATVKADIEAGEITTKEEVDAAFA